jgi:hypothetical protein
MSLVRRISMLARLEIGIVGRTRGAGRAGSAVAASAYNLCARLDDGTRAYDFARKASEHVGGCVLLPTGAPQALAEPGALWRAAEAAERRADAQLARQMLITIPREVAAADRLAFACAVVAHYVADGAAAQVDVHCPGAADGGEQPHAHILLTLRPCGYEMPRMESGFPRGRRTRGARTRGDAGDGVAARARHRTGLRLAFACGSGRRPATGAVSPACGLAAVDERGRRP